MSLLAESGDALAPLGHCRALITVVVTVILAIVVNLAPTSALRCRENKFWVPPKSISHNLLKHWTIPYTSPCPLLKSKKCLGVPQQKQRLASGSHRGSRCRHFCSRVMLRGSEPPGYRRIASMNLCMQSKNMRVNQPQWTISTSEYTLSLAVCGAWSYLPTCNNSSRYGSHHNRQQNSLGLCFGAFPLKWYDTCWSNPYV